MDGDGRMARFLMNTMMAAGGYPRTVIPLPERKAYMAFQAEVGILALKDMSDRDAGASRLL